MKIAMDDQAISKTTKCLFGYKCLDKDSRHPICTVVDINGQNALIVKNDIAFNCPYREFSGKTGMCVCPAHYCLSNRQCRGRSRTLINDRDENPRLCQHTQAEEALPTTVEAAVYILMEELPLKEKAAIAKASAEEVGELTFDLVNHVRNRFGLASGNTALWRSCSKEAGVEIAHPDDASAVIVARLVMELVKTHKLNSV